jgi:hypothetical protein
VSIRDAVRHLLSRPSAEELCDACLALACAASLSDMRAVTQTLLEADRGFYRGASCVRCGRRVPTIAYRGIGSGRRGRRGAAAS